MSGGAFNTPALLQYSGIGPADFLRSVGVEPVHDLPAVGEHLMEHPLVYVTHELKPGNVGLFDAEDPKYALKWLLFRRGKLASNFAETGAHIRTDPTMPAPNFQFLFGAGFFFEHALVSWDAPAAVIGVSLHRAAQSGHRPDPLDGPDPQAGRRAQHALRAVGDGRDDRRRRAGAGDRGNRPSPRRARRRDHSRTRSAHARGDRGLDPDDLPAHVSPGVQRPDRGARRTGSSIPSCACTGSSGCGSPTAR